MIKPSPVQEELSYCNASQGPNSLCDLMNTFLLCEFKLILTSQEEGEKRKGAGVVMVLAKASGDEGLFPYSATNGCGGFRLII